MNADNPSLNDQQALARELAKDAIAFLSCDDRWRVNGLSLQICRAMLQYGGLKAARERWKPTKPQREVLNRLRRQLWDIQDTIRALNPDYRRAIGNLTGFPDDKKALRLSEVDKQLGDVAASTDVVLRFLNPPAGRRRNHGLEAAIRRLLPAFEKLASHVDRTTSEQSAGTAANGGSKSLELLVRTLSRVPSPPSETAILNMVEWVKQNPESKVYDVEAEILRHFAEAAPSTPE